MLTDYLFMQPTNWSILKICGFCTSQDQMILPWYFDYYSTIFTLHSTLKYFKIIPWYYHGPCSTNQGNTKVLLRENVLLPWWMMPFSRRAWPRLIPSSALLISPLSKSHETNSLRTQRDNSCISLHITQHSTHAREGIYESLVKGTWELGFTQSFRVTGQDW